METVSGVVADNPQDIQNLQQEGSCSRCGQVKPLAGFKQCEECRASDRKRYQAKSAQYQAKNRRNLKRLRGRRRQFINDHKRGRPCADCGGEFPPYIMHFHHLGEKEFNVGRMTYYPEERILAEILKCELLCANCHGIRTWGGDD